MKTKHRRHLIALPRRFIVNVFLILDNIHGLPTMSYMPKPSPAVAEPAERALIELGQALRAQRKSLKVSASAAAEAAGVSRTTLHRVERGVPSVTLGACAAVAAALGWQLQAKASGHEDQSPLGVREGWLPVRIALADYPQLQTLAWHARGVDSLTPREALDIYERNARHLDEARLSEAEQALLTALRRALGAPTDRV